MTIDFDLFFQDPLLQELIDLDASSTNFLDIINPRETQHTALLAWALNPREGHGQGDRVLKDFLLAIYAESKKYEVGDRIAGKGLTRDFVKMWSPKRIATTTFGSTIFTREYIVKCVDDEYRIDLLIIDTENKFAIVVENKAGHKLTEKQLAGYLEAITKNVFRRNVFEKYQLAFVVLDRDFETTYDDDAEAPDKTEAPDKRWVMMNYEWLRAAAHRTDRVLKGGESRVGLLNAYCRQLSGMEVDKEASKVATDIAEKYPECVQALRESLKEANDPKTWTPSGLDPTEGSGQLLRFLTQHRQVSRRLIEIRQLDIFHEKLTERLSALISDDNMNWGRAWYSYDLDIEQKIPRKGDGWPLFLKVDHANSKNPEKPPRFNVGYRWSPKLVKDPSRLGEITGWFANIDELRDFKGKRKGRYVPIGVDQSMKEAIDVAVKLVHQVGQVLSAK